MAVRKVRSFLSRYAPNSQMLDSVAFKSLMPNFAQIGQKKYESTDTNLSTPLNKVLFFTALIFTKLQSLKICEHVCRIFLTKWTEM
jgi:hypothetical protein